MKINAIFSESESEKIIKKIFDGSKDIPKEVYERTFKRLSEGVSTGYGSMKDGIDADMVYHLKNNVKVFAAFKANSMSKDMISLLVDKDNKQRTWGSFLKEAKKVDANYNKTWLAAEYNMAIRQARGAKQWSTFQRDKDVYPNLQWMPSRSANQRQVHIKYYGMILPIDHPFWITGYPPKDWGCKCWVQQTKEDITEFSDEDLSPTVPKGIAGNAGIEKKVFTATHNFLDGVDKKGKETVKAFIREQADLGYEEIQLTIGKNKITIPLDADPHDLIDNLNYLKPFVKKYKEDYGINSHTIEGKQPELNQGKNIGDLTTWQSAESAKNYIVTNWKTKYQKQLKDEKAVFIAYDFNGKLDKSNAPEMWQTLNGKMSAGNRISFVLLKNNDKILKIKKGAVGFADGLALISKELL